ncbi:hypothetical protein ACFLZO_01225 [Patescibacteria group bacterium]
MKIVLHYRYLCLKTIWDDVLLQMIDGVSPCLLRPKGSGDVSSLADYLYIVMPIRQ